MWLDWLTVIGTLAAAAVPGVLWFVERRDRRRAEANLHAREEADRVSLAERQAREVFVWNVVSIYPDDADGVRMLNASELPVFEVTLFGYGAHPGRNSLDEDSWSDAVMPGKGFGAPSAGTIAGDVWIAFRDASGRHWARSSRGELLRDPDREGMQDGSPVGSNLPAD